VCSSDLYLGIIKDMNQTITILAKRTGKKTSEEDLKTIKNSQIASIVPKPYITFIHPKYLPKASGQLQKKITHEIERVKQEKMYRLQTRRFQLQQNGTRKREKWPVAEFEREVAKWLKTEKKVFICPFALVRVNKKTAFLLCVDHNTGKLMKINRKGEEITF
jgi:hypothetical protein